MEILLRRGITCISSEESCVTIDGSSAIDSKDGWEVVDDDDQDIDIIKEEPEEKKKATLEASTRKETWQSGLMVITPRNDEMDMEKLKDDIRSIQMEGLIWGPSKLFSVGYGVKLLRIIFIIYDDDLFCFDTLVETHIYNCGRVRSVEFSDFECCPNDDGDLLDEETEEEMKAAGKSGLMLARCGGKKTDIIKKEEERLRSIQMEGVSWGTTKLFNLGYGLIYKRTMFTIIDDRVSLDTIRRKGLGEIPLNRI
ncbi:PREDICTED: elongation factor 1-delta 1-like [Camelina sativa]|uniref:Elongation factor 1-delta 1-like n=1 Tax=Camelina sativa TaxID=90675 RepID=A0ABM1RQE6_CAMSA|nr:PREDICTED: elongation factor 1-delta 1-like [Camelina sativa]